MKLKLQYEPGSEPRGKNQGLSQPSNGALSKQREYPPFSISSHLATSTSGKRFSADIDPRFSTGPRTNFNLDLLMEEIGGRVAVVDACLPPQLADDLRERGASAIWVPAIMGDGASDEEIDRQLLISDWASFHISKTRAECSSQKM